MSQWRKKQSESGGIGQQQQQLIELLTIPHISVTQRERDTKKRKYRLKNVSLRSLELMYQTHGFSMFTKDLIRPGINMCSG